LSPRPVILSVAKDLGGRDIAATQVLRYAQDDKGCFIPVFLPPLPV